MRRAIIILPLIIAGSLACRKAEDPPSTPGDYNPGVPWNIDVSVPTVDRNPFSKKKIELGRMLFYDPILSSDNSISCATCHMQEKAFTDGIALSSLGVSGKQLFRHSPGLINVAWMPGLFWEGGAKDLESLAFGPITNPDEMGQDLRELENELNAHRDYPDLFEKAFGIQDISRVEVARALAQFQRILISGNSKYDQWVRSENNISLSDAEERGLELFRQKCSSCHATDLFTDNGFHNNGLDDDFSNTSHEMIFLGRFRITFDSADLGAFKTPTLRNIMITAPYMHDGRFENIDDVLDHYSSGIKFSPSLDEILKDENSAVRMDLTLSEREDLKSFLNTLTDQDFLTNPDLSDPFLQ